MRRTGVIGAVVFDLDGVIVGSEPVWEQVRRRVVAEHGGHWAADTQRRLMGMSTAEWAGYLSGELGVGLPPGRVAAVVIERMATRYADQLPLMLTGRPARPARHPGQHGDAQQGGLAGR